MTTRLNDGTSHPPRLRLDLNAGTLWSLPSWSAGPSDGSADAQMAAVRGAGYEGLQGGDIEAARRAGLAVTGAGRALTSDQIAPIIAAHQAAGHEATTLHLGTGLENDLEAGKLAEAMLREAERHGHPVFLETHRATITQDIRRTVDLVAALPELRFNADLSHWYTGHELSYGDVTAKLDFMAPVLDRVGFLHGRIGDAGSVQVGLAGRGGEPFIAHFREMWKRCFVGFIAAAGAGDFIVFAPELLPAEVRFDATTYPLNYARRTLSADGTWREETDRWTEALTLCEIAQDCFRAAQVEVSRRGSGSGRLRSG